MFSCSWWTSSANQDAIGGTVNAASLQNPRVNVQKPKLTDRQKQLADFLGSGLELDQIQSLAVTHAAHSLHGFAREALSVAVPYLNKELGGDVIQFARLSTFTNGLQLFGGLVFGSCADKFGPRAAMVAAHCASLSSTTLLYFASSPQQMMLSALPLVAAHGWQAAQQVATVNSPAESRGAALGRLGVSYGAGFFAGTIVISRIAPSVSSHHMVIIAGAVEVGALAFLVFYPTPLECDGDSSETHISNRASLATMAEVLKKPHVASLLVFKTASCTAASMILTMATQYSVDLFGLPASQTALLMAYIGGFQMLSHAVIAPRIGVQSPQTLKAGTCLAVGSSLLGLGLIPVNVPSFVLALAPLTVSFYASIVAIDSTLTCLVEPEFAGTLFGVNGVTWAVAGMVSPVVSAHLFKHIGFSAVPMVGVVVLGLATVSTMTWDAVAANNTLLASSTAAEDDDAANLQ